MTLMQKKPEEVFGMIADDCKRIFGNELLSIILYGSGARTDYMPKRSDLNFMVALTRQGMLSLDAAIEPVKRWRKYNVAIPLFLDDSFLSASLDAYPIEFLNIKRRYKVVYGRDLVASLAFDANHIRLQIERELRGKLMHLRGGWMESEDKPKNLRKLIAVSLTAFVSLFCALLFLKGSEMPDGNNDVITAAGSAFGFDAGVFLDCERIHRGNDNLSSEEVKALFRRYLSQIQQICEKIDQMQIENKPSST
jgi:predicted nucleotidyltransferase